MNSVLTVSIAGTAPLVIAVAALVRRLGSETSTLPVTAEWIDELSAGRYRPMMRLLDLADLTAGGGAR